MICDLEIYQKSINEIMAKTKALVIRVLFHQAKR